MAKRKIPQTDNFAVIDEVRRANAILSCFISSLGDDRADDRYVLWTVEEMLDAIAKSIEQLPSGVEVSHGEA